MPVRKIPGVLILLIALLSSKGFGQSNSSFYYHEGSVPTPPVYEEAHGRPCKTEIEAGLVFGFAGADGHYTNGVSASTGYEFGLIEEIPVQKRSYLLIGAEILGDGVGFNSYYIAPGYNYLYDGSEAFSHSISMNEIHVPILYKFPLGPLDRKNRSIYMTFGWKWRYISFTNTSITSNTAGYLVWEGTRDVSSVYKILSSYGSSIFEVSLGYQRNTKKKKKRGWFMNLEYNYGVSPFYYSGNMMGSNDFLFHLNTLVFKIGKIF